MMQSVTRQGGEMTDILFELDGSDKRKYPIKSSGLTLGSHSSNDVVIHDSNVFASHAQILLADGRLWVRDNNTKSGTYVNGQPIAGQQEIVAGDELKIGSATFLLKKNPITQSSGNRSRKGIVIVGIATATLFLFILMIGNSGLVKPGLIFLPTATISPTPPANSPLMITSLPKASPSSIVIQPDLTSSPTPNFNASIACTDLDQYKDIHACSITNLGTVRDTLWLLFSPHRLENTNSFNLSVIHEGEGRPTFTDRKGKISLGDFEPGMGKNILLQMICVDTLIGCPLTTVQVQLLANNGNFPISSVNAILGIKNIASGKTATPTMGSVKATQPTQPPTISPPTLTSTPSDAFGPTASPQP